jgi:translation initiation factor IF-3
MDYGKFKYEAAQKAKESRRKTTQISIKEMKYRVKIGKGDFDTKTKKVEHFLGEGHKVKLTIMFRGREVHHPELGMRILERVAEHNAHLAKVEAAPRLDGRNMVMVLAPDKRVQAEWARKQAEEAAEAGSDSTEAAEAGSDSTAAAEAGSDVTAAAELTSTTPDIDPTTAAPAATNGVAADGAGAEAEPASAAADEE